MKDGDTIAGDPSSTCRSKKTKEETKGCNVHGTWRHHIPRNAVVSAMQYIDGADGVIVATGTLIGGLVGYVALMSL